MYQISIELYTNYKRVKKIKMYCSVTLTRKPCCREIVLNLEFLESNIMQCTYKEHFAVGDKKYFSSSIGVKIIFEQSWRREYEDNKEINDTMKSNET